MVKELKRLIHKHQLSHERENIISAARDFGEIEPLLEAFKNREKWTFENEEAHKLIVRHHEGGSSRKKSKDRPEFARLCVVLARFYFGYFDGNVPMYNTTGGKGCCCSIASRNLYAAGLGLRAAHSIKKDRKEYVGFETEDISRGEYTRLYEHGALPASCVFPDYYSAIELRKVLINSSHSEPKTLLRGAINRALVTGKIPEDISPIDFVHIYCRIECQLKALLKESHQSPNFAKSATAHLEGIVKIIEFSIEEYLPGNPFPSSSPLHKILVPSA